MCSDCTSLFKIAGRLVEWIPWPWWSRFVTTAVKNSPVLTLIFQCLYTVLAEVLQSFSPWDRKREKSHSTGCYRGNKNPNTIWALRPQMRKLSYSFLTFPDFSEIENQTCNSNFFKSSGTREQNYWRVTNKFTYDILTHIWVRSIAFRCEKRGAKHLHKLLGLFISSFFRAAWERRYCTCSQ